MTLTEHQQLNTVTPAYDVQLRYFGGVVYRSIAASGIATLLASFTDPDDPAAGWTELTDRISYASRVTQTWRGSSITWQAELSGWNYDDTLLETGLTVLCFRRIWRPTGTTTAPAGWQSWSVAYIGEIVDKVNKDDYRHGQEWSRTIVGHDHLLSTRNAPRLEAGKLQATEGASVSGTVELATPEDERDTGEFVGGRASVALSNLVDGNLNTVYVSSTIPSGTSVAWPNPYWDGFTIITEVFFKPYAGWSVDRAWWVEVFNARSNDNSNDIGFRCATYSGGTYTYYNDFEIGRGRLWPKLETGQCGLFVGNRTAFDQLNGSDNIGAQWIVDISEFGDYHLSDDACVVAGGYIIAWAPGGASRDYVFDSGSGYTYEWHGATLNSTSCGTGQSFANPTGGGFTVNAYPHPGANGTGVGPIHLKVLLNENVCLTLDEVTSASTSIRLDNYLGWVQPASSYKRGSILGKVFRWTSRDASGLHGVTWESAPSSPIPAGTRCYPYENSIAQTGLPITATHLVRRKLPTVQNYRVYWSPYDARPYTDAGWQTDYYDHYHDQQGNTQNLRLSDTCSDGTNNYLWVRTILYLIDGMTDGGRVKLNEIEADVDQLAMDVTATDLLDGGNSYSLAAYLFSDWCGLDPSDIVDATNGGRHLMGEHALAITPVSRVFDDLAQATGCLAYYRMQGGVYWIEDPWWPLKANATSAQYAFDTTAIRGQVELIKLPSDTEYIVLNGVSVEGGAHSIRAVYPTPYDTVEPPAWAITQEIGDRIVARDSDAKLVAQMEWEKLVIGSQTCRFAVAGVGEWCHPATRVTLTWDLDGDGTAETSTWLIEQVTTTMEATAQDHSYETVLQMRRFRG